MTTYKPRSNPVRAALSSLLARFARVQQRLRDAGSKAAARRTLMQLNDATLRDLGMDRTEIGSVVSEAFGDAERSRLRLRRPSRGRL